MLKRTLESSILSSSASGRIRGHAQELVRPYVVSRLMSSMRLPCVCSLYMARAADGCNECSLKNIGSA